LKARSGYRARKRVTNLQQRGAASIFGPNSANLEALQFGSPTILAADQYEACSSARANRG
jgi:hypothetical protein